MKKTVTMLAAAAAMLCTMSPAMQAQGLSIDGPYLFHLSKGGARIVTVDSSERIDTLVLKPLPADYTLHVVDHEGQNAFDVQLHDFSRPQWKYDMPGRLFVMSDPHGRMDCFVSVLKGNGVISDDLHWSFGDGHLMIIGDVADRGEDVTQIYWLIYKLEREAELAGGCLHFLLGNHETLMLMDDLRYTKEKYKLLAGRTGHRVPDFWTVDTELGRWLCTRNTMEVIGDNLFVHAGLSARMASRRLSVPLVNEMVSRGLYLDKDGRKQSAELIYFLFRNEGPIWYRGLVYDDEKYKPATEDELDAVLAQYGVSRMFVGHTIFDEVTLFHGGKVVAVNVDNRENMERGGSRAVLVSGDEIKIVGDRP